MQEEPALSTAADETEITACLQQVLNELRNEPEKGVDGFSGSMFETITREGAEVDYSGTSLRKQPDLVVRVRNLHPGAQDSPNWAAFIECKIVSRSHPVRLYCKHGVSRFVDGEYAWAMPSAMMVAYARDSKTVEGSLIPHLARHRKSTSDPYATQQLPMRLSELFSQEPAVYASSHERQFQYPDGRLPGPVEILHVWLLQAPPGA